MNKLILTTLLFTSTAGYCEKLKFSNNNEEVEIVGNAQIDFQTGDIVVETVGDHLIVQSEPLEDVILGFYPSDYDVGIGDSITAYWSVANANTCSASVTSGLASNWSGSVSANDGDNSISGITVSQLPATLRLVCDNTLPGNVSKTFQITEQSGGGGGGSPDITYFRVDGFNNSTTVTPPGDATVTWSSTDTTSCTASSTPTIAGWNGSVATTNGSTTINVTENTQLTLTCNTDSENFSITYSNNSDCSTSVYPPGLTIDNMTYGSINDGFAFGEDTDTDVLIDIQNSHFASVSGFSLAFPNFRRRMDFVTPPTTHKKAIQSTVSISECPGDFSGTAVCSKVMESFRSMSFSTNASDNPLLYCILDPAKTYYMNVINSPAPYTESPRCQDLSDSRCAVFYTETEL